MKRLLAILALVLCFAVGTAGCDLLDSMDVQPTEQVSQPNGGDPPDGGGNPPPPTCPPNC